MKVFFIIILVCFAVCFVIIYSKPSDQECTEKGKEIVNVNIVNKMPGFFNPDDPNLDSVALSSPQLLIVKDKVFWKEIHYSWNGNIKLIGNGYFGSIHKVTENK